ncbi:ImmA/IrrE family metallo-endopeptidase [Curtobacterium sp. MCLR17_042]|uniref:ImmA/IrrE family metallo-endopeptidase n=1 Tax=Curtobacterium sp. MCLR17_042 TaxID=2175626 RepID=UPI0015E8AB9C|nr:ImmA/IrrE family metallo-endopeptidase [Curtobacterium sp. MCLR17_042]
MQNDPDRTRRGSPALVAGELGVRITHAHLPGNMIGCYNPLEERVYADLRLTPFERRSVIAHELGHVYYGHTCDLGMASAIERQADAFAASLLIDPIEYARCEMFNADVHAIADDLCVTVDIVKAFRRHILNRISDRTYAGHRRVG